MDRALSDRRRPLPRAALARYSLDAVTDRYLAVLDAAEVERVEERQAA